ncbi:MAG: deoxyribonuclease IV [Bacilli bacterium]|nr:deoxyribonuclease IV [Bacilli bacterium]
MNLIIGSHVSFVKDKQLLGSVEEALNYGSNAFMIYTGAPQNTNRIPLNNDLNIKGKELIIKNNIDFNNIIVHAPYIINLANKKDEEFRNFTLNFLKQEIKRCEELGIYKLVLHPGSHVGLGEEVGLNNIVDGLNIVLEDNSPVKILIETMSGKGTECCYKFEHINYIMDNVKNNDRLEVCMDSCHMSDAGYDITKFDILLDEFDKIVGLNKVSAIHINDSKNNIGDKKDRHANIGYGNLGFDNIINIIYNKRLENIPKILETPYIENTYPPYKFEIEMIKNKIFNPNLIETITKYYKNL